MPPADMESNLTRDNLMDLALDAAIEIERAIHHQEIQQDIIRKLFDALDGSVKLQPVAGGPQLLFTDPRVVTIFERTLSNIGVERPTTVDGVRQWIEQFVRKFRADSSLHSEGPNGGLANLRSFCLALHRELLSESLSDQPEIAWPDRDQDEPRIASHPY